MNGILIIPFVVSLSNPPSPFVVSLSNHNAYFCKRLTSVQLFGMNNHKEKKQKEIRLMPDAEVGTMVVRHLQV